MTQLAEVLKRRIALTGPLTIAEFMVEALSHPEHGYYTTRDPFGASGDFITAPDVSQMFGELIGLVLAQAWVDQGRPAAFNLVELGPGRGTLMADALRATARVPGFNASAKVRLVEISAPLKELQRQTIPTEVTHYATLNDIPEGPTFLVANEFFDALPVRQFVRAEGGWRERVIGLQNAELAFGLTEIAQNAALADEENRVAPGDMVTLPVAHAAIAAEIGRRIASDGGLGLIIDYGDPIVQGDTLQAMQAHQKVDVLAAPGDSDITAHVGFDAIAAAVAPARATAAVPQGVWLERLGITARAQALAQNLSDAALEQHIAAHRRLTHPEEMGTLFKVMAIHPARHGPPSGLFE